MIQPINGEERTPADRRSDSEGACSWLGNKDGDVGERANGDRPTAEWHCVQTRPKSEHIAGASLKQFEDVEVFCPRIRYHKSTRRGKVWFTEALFPGYLFARFALETRLRAVGHANGVSKILRYGDRYAVLPPELIEQIRCEMGGEDIRTIVDHDSFEIGEETEVGSGPLRGFQGIVTRLLSGGERVRLLIEMFGELNEVEVRSESLLSTKHPRSSLA